MIVTNGLGSQQLVLRGYGDFGTHYGVVSVVVNTWPFTEAVPTDGYSLESKPSNGYSLEAVPTRPSAGDGFWTDGTSDGFYDEYPLEGFYAKEGYDPEPKPVRRATPSQESVPSATFTTEGKPN